MIDLGFRVKDSGIESTIDCVMQISYMTDVEGHWPYFCNFVLPASF